MTMIYRGAESDVGIASHSPITWFTAESDEDAGWERAWSYTWGSQDGVVYRAKLAGGVRGSHPDFENDLAGTEDGDGSLSELLAEMDADYLMHDEGGVRTVGLRTERLPLLLAGVEKQTKAEDPDEWRTV